MKLATAHVYNELAQWAVKVFKNCCKDYTSILDRGDEKALTAQAFLCSGRHSACCLPYVFLSCIFCIQILENPYRQQIKPLHTKVKGVIKAFKPVNDAMKLSILVAGFDKTLSDLNTLMDQAIVYVTVTLGLRMKNNRTRTELRCNVM